MDEYKKCIKGHKGFCKKYKFLGRTINKKIPSDYANEISEIIFLLDKKAEIEFDKTGSIEKANQKVEKLLNVIITNLKIGISVT